jgi:hypothetical protein
MSVAVPPLPQYDFMAWCLVKAQGQLYLFTFYSNNFTFTFTSLSSVIFQNEELHNLYYSLNASRMEHKTFGIRLSDIYSSNKLTSTPKIF